MARDPLLGVRIKIERAKRHIRDLESEARAFHARGPYELVADDDPQTGNQLIRVRIKEAVPPSLSGIIGDIIHNLRASLDQLAWQLVIANHQQPRRRTGFPIGSSAKDFEADATGKIKGVSTRADRIIRRLKPYKGGNEPFWLIHELDRIDKHQSIIPVGTAFAHFTSQLRMRVPWQEALVDFPPFAIAPAKRMYPLKDGAVVYIVPAAARVPNPDIQEDIKFTFQIAFGEGQIVDGEPVLPTLQQLIDFTERVINIFARRTF